MSRQIWWEELPWDYASKARDFLKPGVRVLDLSPEEGAYPFGREPAEAVRWNGTGPLPFADGEFDLIFHPVSNCYVREVRPIFRECARVLKPGGALLSGLDNGINYLFDETETTLTWSLPFDPLKNPEQLASLQKGNEGVQFSHTLEEQIGGQLEAGLTLTHVYEDTNGEGKLHEHNVPTFWATRAVKAAP